MSKAKPICTIWEKLCCAFCKFFQKNKPGSGHKRHFHFSSTFTWRLRMNLKKLSFLRTLSVFLGLWARFARFSLLQKEKKWFLLGYNGSWWPKQWKMGFGIRKSTLLKKVCKLFQGLRSPWVTAFLRKHQTPKGSKQRHCTRTWSMIKVTQGSWTKYSRCEVWTVKKTRRKTWPFLICFGRTSERFTKQEHPVSLMLFWGTWCRFILTVRRIWKWGSRPWRDKLNHFQG